MIDNRELIKPLFYFNEGNDMFMHCQIVCRNKDHKESVKERTISSYFIRSREHLERLMPEVICLCEHYGARAYINPAGKDFDALQKSMLKIVATDVADGNIRDLSRVLTSAAGELKSRTRRWVVDIDDISLTSKVWNWLCTYRPGDDIGRIGSQVIFAEIPTVNGCHLITEKFNTLEFSKEFPDVSVHKNSMGTLLYYPKSLDKNG